MMKEEYNSNNNYNSEDKFYQSNNQNSHLDVKSNDQNENEGNTNEQGK